MIVKHFFAALILAVLSFGMSQMPADAQPTHVVVRARSADAKFIGTHTGGVSVVLTDAASGKVLAQGVIAGGTGDTARIMQTPPARFGALSDAETAGFEAVLDITRPTLVKAEARGPLGRPLSQITVSSMMWIIPGRDVLGDGWVLTFPGLAIEAKVVREAGRAPKINADVTMMCGCPITPGGLWDSNDVTVEAVVLKDERVVARTALDYAGTASQFAGDVPKAGPGHFVLRVIAVSKKTPNAGVVDLPLDQ